MSLAAALEVSARLYWRIQHGVPLLEPSALRWVFYPNVDRIRSAPPQADDGVHDVLVLGGSVMDETRDRFREVEEELGGAVRFHVAAKVGHTTLDSRRKFEWLADLPFDEVLVYHGINDCKYNNVPPERFDADYSGYVFYRLTGELVNSPPQLSVAPFTFRYIRAKGGLRGQDSVDAPTRVARHNWFRFGEDIKSRETFRANLAAVLEGARSRGLPVRLLSFVIYIPEGYDEQTFLDTGYDYAEPRMRAGVWGQANHVSACVAEHNRILHALAAEHDHAALLDMQEAVPAAGWAMNDPCHFSEPGEELFFARLADAYRDSAAGARALAR